MPAVVVEAGFRVAVYGRDHPPPHVHVHKAGRVAQIVVWADRVEAYANVGMSARELAKAMKIRAEHDDRIVEVLRRMPRVE